jgi:hypothetical protein
LAVALGLKSKPRGETAAVEAPVDEAQQLFSYWPQEHQAAAEAVRDYVVQGQGDPAGLALTRDQLRALKQQWMEQPGNHRHFADLSLNHQRLSAQQWIRLGRVLAVLPYGHTMPPRPAAVPDWLAYLQSARAQAIGHHQAWEPDFVLRLLAGDPFYDPDRAALAAFWDSFPLLSVTGGYSSYFDRDVIWLWGKQARPAERAWVRYVRDQAETAVATLVEASTSARASALVWAGVLPDLAPVLAPAVVEIVLDRTKAVRQAALDLVAGCPAEIRQQVFLDVIDRTPTAQLSAVIDRVVRLGDAGRPVLEAALAQGDAGRRGEWLRAALETVALVAPPAGRSESGGEGESGGDAAAVAGAAPPPDAPPGAESSADVATACGLTLPPVTPPPPGPEPSLIVPAMETSLAQQVAAAERRLAEHPSNWWRAESERAELDRLRLVDRSQLVQLVDYLNFKTDQPPAFPGLAHHFARFMPRFPLAGVARAYCHPTSQGIPWSISKLKLRDEDLRTILRALATTDLPDPVSETAQLAFWIIGRLSPQHVWPFFAQHPFWLELVLGLVPNSRPEYHDDSHRLLALRILAMFPSPPPQLLPVLVEWATDSDGRYRRQAQAVLEGWPGAVGLAVQKLTSTGQEARANAAAWLGRLGDPGAVEALSRAWSKEKREPVQAAILVALTALGQDISQYLTPEVLGRAAVKGLAGRFPADFGWFPLDGLPACRWATGEPVDPVVIRWWAVLADKLKDPMGVGLIPIYVGLLDAPSREALGRFALEAWIARDTRRHPDEECRRYAAEETKSWMRSWLHDHDDETEEQVFERKWRERSMEYLGSAIASKGVLALAAGVPGHLVAELGQRYSRDHRARRAQLEALVCAAAANDSPAAIQFVLGIARSHRQETVRTKAGELALQLAERQGWSMDQLADRTIATAGFDQDGVLELDLGRRQFQGRIVRRPKTGAFAIELFNSEGQPVKALPKAGVGDDPELFKQTAAQLSGARKELTQTVKLQTARLFEAMCSGRSWPAAEWRQLWAEQPLMRPLVATLVWKAVAPDGERLFRPTPEGEWLDEDDEAVVLGPADRVELAHRVTIGPEKAELWRDSLADYHIRPLFDQFTAPPPQFAAEADTIDDHKGWLSDSFAIRARAGHRGYTRGVVEEGSWFNYYQKKLPSAGLVLQLCFTGALMTEGQVPAAVTELVFRQADFSQLELSEVWPILLAEAYADYVYVAEAGTFDPDWEVKTRV